MSELKWRVIYPCYINAEKTIDMGRRVSLKYALSNPKADEII
jgi:signal recognition particle subunit SEC65